MEMSKLQNGIWISRKWSGDYEMLKINVHESIPDLGRKEMPHDNEANEDSPTDPPSQGYSSAYSGDREQIHIDLLVIFSARNCVFTTSGLLLWDSQGHKWRKMVMLTSGLSLIIRKPWPTVGCLCRKTHKTASPDRCFPAGPAPVWSYSLQCIGWDRLGPEPSSHQEEACGSHHNNC